MENKEFNTSLLVTWDIVKSVENGEIFVRVLIVIFIIGTFACILMYMHSNPHKRETITTVVKSNHAKKKVGRPKGSKTTPKRKPVPRRNKVY